MAENNQELEVKYYISDLAALEEKTIQLGAVLAAVRVFELNLRFDTPGRTLAHSFQVLRLRRDTAARLTYKGPGEEHEGVRVRQEIEFVVEDFERARALLEALGYQVVMTYEKFRTTYDLDGVHVTLDELPYGTFAELEGPDPASISTVSQLLGLNWDARLPESYTALFERLRFNLKLPFTDLTFENFQQVMVHPEDLNARPADQPA